MAPLLSKTLSTKLQQQQSNSSFSIIRCCNSVSSSPLHLLRLLSFYCCLLFLFATSKADGFRLREVTSNIMNNDVEYQRFGTRRMQSQQHETSHPQHLRHLQGFGSVGTYPPATSTMSPTSSSSSSSLGATVASTTTGTSSPVTTAPPYEPDFTEPDFSGGKTAEPICPAAFGRDDATAGTAETDSIMTEYNNDPAVLTYMGLFFSLQTKYDPIELLTIEVDMRNDVANGDSYVEVYITKGNYRDGDSFHNESAWTLLAATNAIAFPGSMENSMLIPANNFTPVVLAPQEDYSLYVTMRDCSCLDSTVYALDKTGEVANSNADLTILVGQGATEYKFPATLDTLVDPKFAGILYYRKQPFDPCSGENATAGATTDYLTTTFVEYDFLLGAEVEADITKLVDQALDTYMASSETVKGYEQSYQLTKVASGITQPQKYDGGCPTSWGHACQEVYMNTTFEISHSSLLSRNDVLYAFYQGSDAITAELLEKVGADQVYYLGLTSVQGTYTTTITGIPPSTTMDAIQTEYFAQTTQDFFEQMETDNTFHFYRVTVDEQKLVNVQRNRQLRGGNGDSSTSSGSRWLEGEDSLTVSGTIQGSKFNYALNQDVEALLDEGFANNEDVFRNLLALNVLLPSPINQGSRGKYFQALTYATGDATFEHQVLEGGVEPPAQNVGGLGGVVQAVGGAPGDMSNNNFMMIIIVVIVIIVLAVCGGAFLYHLKMQKEAKVKQYNKLQQEKKRLQEIVDRELEKLDEDSSDDENDNGSKKRRKGGTEKTDGADSGENISSSDDDDDQKSKNSGKRLVSKPKEIPKRAKSMEELGDYLFGNGLLKKEAPARSKSSDLDSKNSGTDGGLASYLNKAATSHRPKDRPSGARTVGGDRDRGSGGGSVGNRSSGDRGRNAPARSKSATDLEDSRSLPGEGGRGGRRPPGRSKSADDHSSFGVPTQRQPQRRPSGNSTGGSVHSRDSRGSRAGGVGVPTQQRRPSEKSQASLGSHLSRESQRSHESSHRSADGGRSVGNGSLSGFLDKQQQKASQPPADSRSLQDGVRRGGRRPNNNTSGARSVCEDYHRPPPNNNNSSSSSGGSSYKDNQDRAPPSRSRSDDGVSHASRNRQDDDRSHASRNRSGDGGSHASRGRPGDRSRNSDGDGNNSSPRQPRRTESYARPSLASYMNKPKPKPNSQRDVKSLDGGGERDAKASSDSRSHPGDDRKNGTGNECDHSPKPPSRARSPKPPSRARSVDGVALTGMFDRKSQPYECPAKPIRESLRGPVPPQSSKSSDGTRPNLASYMNKPQPKPNNQRDLRETRSLDGSDPAPRTSKASSDSRSHSGDDHKNGTTNESNQSPKPPSRTKSVDGVALSGMFDRKSQPYECPPTPIREAPRGGRVPPPRSKSSDGASPRRSKSSDGDSLPTFLQRESQPYGGQCSGESMSLDGGRPCQRGVQRSRSDDLHKFDRKPQPYGGSSSTSAAKENLRGAPRSAQSSGQQPVRADINNNNKNNEFIESPRRGRRPNVIPSDQSQKSEQQQQPEKKNNRRLPPHVKSFDPSDSEIRQQRQAEMAPKQDKKHLDESQFPKRPSLSNICYLKFDKFEK